MRFLAGKLRNVKQSLLHKIRALYRNSSSPAEKIRHDLKNEYKYLGRNTLKLNDQTRTLPIHTNEQGRLIYTLSDMHKFVLNATPPFLLFGFTGVLPSILYQMYTNLVNLQKAEETTILEYGTHFGIDAAILAGSIFFFYTIKKISQLKIQTVRFEEKANKYHLTYIKNMSESTATISSEDLIKVKTFEVSLKERFRGNVSINKDWHIIYPLCFLNARDFYKFFSQSKNSNIDIKSSQ